MMVIVFKSVLLFALLFGLYLLVLSRLKMPAFNRYFLLCIPILSLSIPFIPLVGFDQVKIDLELHNLIGLEPIGIRTILLIIYIIVTSLFIGRFVHQLFILIRQLRQNEKIKSAKTTIVLLNEPVVPHTFFRWIFVYAPDYKNNNIDPILFTHEKAHVNQYHSLDVIFAQWVKILFWFNPVVFAWYNQLRLNHEYLADAVVIENHGKIDQYQRLLLHLVDPKPRLALVSSSTFSRTRTRFIMMGKQPRKPLQNLVKLTLVPLFVLLLFLFSNPNSSSEHSNGEHGREHHLHSK
ncbi:M56 family metallopeptidase [Sediminicola luteus]|uniref:Peptidase M56 domain-containing protein n=1 Tax=Sediminicola luteus TaxID=319238 RepID=A0A2A4GF27_9FLAO|nr:M56 family metallopeptidase [Sediminicola luteus]PCE66580.1 hypothetical protein B7P33_04590 [Sediminicola luteus]